MIVIKRVYSWFNVYVDSTLVLKHVSKEDVIDIVIAAIEDGCDVHFRINFDDYPWY